MQGNKEIRWHGRGGQGAITAAKIVANTSFFSGYSGVVMAPTFGTERRGAPVFTSLKISKRKIYDLSPIVNPDMVIVLDHQLLEEANVTSGLKPGGLVVINTPQPPSAFKIEDARVATADVTPSTLNLKSKGKWITSYIELPEGYRVRDIDISTVKLNGEISAELHPTEIGDYDEDGVPDLMVKFNRKELIAIFSVGEATLRITGEVNDTSFEGSDTIRVIEEGM